MTQVRLHVLVRVDSPSSGAMQMLWMPDDQLRDEVWVDEEEVDAIAEAEKKAGKPPPSVIPFIKVSPSGLCLASENCI